MLSIESPDKWDNSERHGIFTLSDLLPLIFDQIAKGAVREALLPKVREAVLLSLNNTIRLCAQVEGREASKADDILITADHFCSRSVSRSETVSLIAKSSGLSHRLAHLSLILIETRVDIVLAEQSFLHVTSLGQLQFASGDGELRACVRDWCRDVFSATLRYSECSAREFIFSNWLYRKNRLLGGLVDLIEAAAIYRPSMAYQISLERKVPTLPPNSDTRKRLTWEEKPRGEGHS